MLWTRLYIYHVCIIQHSALHRFRIWGNMAQPRRFFRFPPKNNIFFIWPSFELASNFLLKHETSSLKANSYSHAWPVPVPAASCRHPFRIYRTRLVVHHHSNEYRTIARWNNNIWQLSNNLIDVGKLTNTLRDTINCRGPQSAWDS